MEYELELDRVVAQIRKQKAKLVCLQLPDGLKPQANHIKNEIEEKTDCTALIWAGTCFGACDLPLELKNLNVDLLVQFGHSEWK